MTLSGAASITPAPDAVQHLSTRTLLAVLIKLGATNNGPRVHVTERGNPNEVRVFGPPGTGKTTWLAGSVRATAKSRHSSKIVVGSFTRSAASEIAGRGLPIPREQVGTLHALAYRAIGHPQVADEVAADWNAKHPALAITPGFKDMGDAGVEFRGSTDGDDLLARLDTLRARQTPMNLWPVQVQQFARRWVAWKQEAECVDFTDMIELALENTECAPGEPQVGFFDEFQDFTPLEIALVRHWGRQMERLIIAGDDDQCIYSFKGATPDAFLDPPVPDEQKRVLAQSYRIPAAVHRLAEAWVRRLKRREEKEYLPRDEEGVVRYEQGYTFESPDYLLRDVIKQVDAGRSVMVIATCAYMLDPFKHAMREEGLPFWNPGRLSRADWNPLRAKRGQVSGAERLLAYMVMDEDAMGEASRLWTGGDVKRWSSVIRKAVFRRGAGGLIEGLPDRELSFEELAALFDDQEQLEEACQPSVAWFQRNLLAADRQRMEYPITVVRKRGPLALAGDPRVVLGTIHSQKGSEAQVTYLFPDLSLAGAREWDQPATRDAIVRQVYVGMTRPSEELVLCGPSSSYCVDPALILRGR